MAFLMLLHEKMRLQRRYNKLTLKQLRMGNKIDRIKRNIEKKQKYYQKLEANIDNMAKRWQNNANLYINNMFGIGTNGWNPSGLFSGYGVGNYLTRSAIDNISNILGSNDPNSDAGKLKGDLGNLSQEQIVQILQSGGLNTFKEEGKDENGKLYKSAAFSSIGKITEKQYSALYKLGTSCGQFAQQDRMYAQQYQTDYTNNISIWVEAQKEQLNAEQDMVLDALQDQENDYEMEKTSIETELEYIKERKQALESALAEGVKDSAPKFGLG